ncbi:hypothetical protein SNEBB_004328 [Seison nebaliae]|nr:hypothetical protein SNEBB_004328 [Seison nebaliae]
MEENVVCEKENCSEIAKLQCPKCEELDLSPSCYCSQKCFQDCWKSHKVKHSMKKLPEKNGSMSEVTTKNRVTKDQLTLPKEFYGYGFTGPLRPTHISKKRVVPSHINRPDYADHSEGESFCEVEEKKKPFNIVELNEEEKELMRIAGKLGREVLDEGMNAIDVGVTTDEIDRIIHEACIERECYPSPLNYYEFPKSVCTSINEVICHGIPDYRPLKNGDIINLDVTVYHKGFHADLNETLFVRTINKKTRNLIEAAYESLEAAIQLVQPGNKFRDIGRVIQNHVAKKGFSVVKSYCGHGVHRLFHCAPNVPHYHNKRAVGIIKSGQSFTIEPMINEGVWQDQLWPDNWTAVTADGKLSAQFEHTLLVNDESCDILTANTSRTKHLPWFKYLTANVS